MIILDRCSFGGGGNSFGEGASFSAPRQDVRGIMYDADYGDAAAATFSVVSACALMQQSGIVVCY